MYNYSYQIKILKNTIASYNEVFNGSISFEEFNTRYEYAIDLAGEFVSVDKSDNVGVKNMIDKISSFIRRKVAA